MSEEQVEQEVDQLEEWITRNPDKSITLRLEEPVDVADKPYNELRLRRPRAKHLRELRMSEEDGAKGMDFGAAMDLGARLASVSPAVVGELSVDDAMRLGEVIGSFFDSSPKATKTP